MAAMMGIVIIVVIKKFSSTRPAFIRPGKSPMTRIDVKVIIPARNRMSCRVFGLFIIFLSGDKILSWEQTVF